MLQSSGRTNTSHIILQDEYFICFGMLQAEYFIILQDECFACGASGRMLYNTSGRTLNIYNTSGRILYNTSGSIDEHIIHIMLRDLRDEYFTHDTSGRILYK